MADRGGRTQSAATVRRQVARVMNRSAHQLSEAVLAKALTGDSNAQIAAVEMLKLWVWLNRPNEPHCPARRVAS